MLIGNSPQTGGDLPEDVPAVFFTADASSYFGVPALLGRGLLPSDAPVGQDPQPVVVLSFSFWQRRFAGDPQIVGKSLSMSHRDYTIVGVLPLRFALDHGRCLSCALLWLSCVKLKPGVSVRAAEAEVQPLLEVFAKQDPMVLHRPVECTTVKKTG